MTVIGFRIDDCSIQRKAKTTGTYGWFVCPCSQCNLPNRPANPKIDIPVSLDLGVTRGFLPRNLRVRTGSWGYRFSAKSSLPYFPFFLCLTFLGIVEDLHFAFLGPQQGLCQLGQGALHGAGADQELAGAGLLHDLRPREAEHLTEALVAVDDAAVLHLGVGDQKLAI